MSSYRFTAGNPIKLDLAPGVHTVVLWAFSDAEMNVLIGSACTQHDLPAGGQICLDLQLASVPDGGIDLATPPDLSPPPCSASAMECGSGESDICCDPQNGTCSSACAISCNAQYGDCNQSANDGCETPLTTISHCSACNAACDTTSSTGAGCNGTKCTYGGCAANRQNCDTSGVDSNGCECEGSTCCGSSCQTKHSDGYGDFWYDCVALKTYNQVQAEAAGQAWDPAGTFPATKDPLHYSDSKGTADAVCRNSVAKNACVCFLYGVTGNYAPYLGTSYASKQSGTCQIGIVGQVAQYPPWN
jgi:hypothetical protein